MRCPAFSQESDPVIVNTAGYLEKVQGDCGNISQGDLISRLGRCESVTPEYLLCHSIFSRHEESQMICSQEVQSLNYFAETNTRDTDLEQRLRRENTLRRTPACQHPRREERVRALKSRQRRLRRRGAERLKKSMKRTTMTVLTTPRSSPGRDSERRERPGHSP